MPSLRSVAALCFIAGHSVATPIESRGTFTLKEVRVDSLRKHPVRERAATDAKFGGTVPAERAALARRSDSGSVPAKASSNPGEWAYLVPVKVGDTTMMLQIDTGSSDLWVFSDQLPSDRSTGHTIYPTDPGKKMANAS